MVVTLFLPKGIVGTLSEWSRKRGEAKALAVTAAKAEAGVGVAGGAS